MRVFVLTTGRSGSVTFARSCSHITNYSSAHESRAAEYGAARFDYADQHIEIDNRLSWFLGGLEERFPEARYVHLRRDPAADARSFAARWPCTLRGPGRRRRQHGSSGRPGSVIPGPAWSPPSATAS